MREVVLDTNVFVAAGFEPDSASGRLVREVREGNLRLIWNEETRDETERVVRKIPPLSWGDFQELFATEGHHRGQTHPGRFQHVPDPTDRKFAALADAADAILVSQDDDLVATRRPGGVTIYAPHEMTDRL